MKRTPSRRPGSASRQDGLDPTVVSPAAKLILRRFRVRVQARGEPDFLQNTHFVKSDGPRVTTFRALAPKLAPVSTGEMSKVPASIVSLLLESELSGGVRNGGW